MDFLDQFGAISHSIPDDPFLSQAERHTKTVPEALVSDRLVWRLPLYSILGQLLGAAQLGRHHVSLVVVEGNCATDIGYRWDDSLHRARGVGYEVAIDESAYF